MRHESMHGEEKEKERNVKEKVLPWRGGERQEAERGRGVGEGEMRMTERRNVIWETMKLSFGNEESSTCRP